MLRSQNIKNKLNDDYLHFFCCFFFCGEGSDVKFLEVEFWIVLNSRVFSFKSDELDAPVYQQGQGPFHSHHREGGRAG